MSENPRMAFTCDDCGETYVPVHPPTVDIEQFIQEEPCPGCGHRSLRFRSPEETQQ